MAHMKILIVGAGMAGLTAAYWLNHYGFHVDLIEKNPRDRLSLGYVIDVWGPGFSVLEKMGLLDRLYTKNCALDDFVFINASGEIVSKFSIPKFRQIHGNRVLTLLRGDLEQALSSIISESSPIRYGVTIDQLTQKENHVSVVFSDQQAADYDLVIGADGVHSLVRDKVFGKKELFSHELGYELAVAMLPNHLQLTSALYTYSDIGKQVTVCPTHENQLACYFVYRSNENTQNDRRAALFDTFQHDQWLVPALLKEIQHDSATFFDSLTQIVLPTWYENRVVLLGDACHCLTLMGGQGASMAIAAAWVLAHELHANRENLTSALQQYNAIVKPEMLEKQKIAQEFLSHFIPNNQVDITSRHYFTRQFFKKMYAQKRVSNRIEML